MGCSRLLRCLRVKNVALIDETEVEFREGLNVLSGETGAGKSMLIDSLNFVLGERSDKDFIRSGEDAASVEAVFEIASPDVRRAVSELGVEPDCDGCLLLSRSLNTAGKGACRINGRGVTAGMLKAVSELLVDIHGQHAHQSLLNANRHIALLDRFCGARADDIKLRLSKNIAGYKRTVKEIEAIPGGADKEALVERLTYEKRDIEQAGLRPGDDARLAARRAVLKSGVDIAQNVGLALAMLKNEDEAASALGYISAACAALRGACRYDASLDAQCENLESLREALAEAARELERYYGRIESGPDALSALNELEARLDTVDRLKRRYGGSVESVLEHYEGVCRRLDDIENAQAALDGLAARKRAYTENILRLCSALSAARRNAAAGPEGGIEAKVAGALAELGMRDARFEIQIQRKRQFSSNGFDDVEFMISPNPGEPLKPLARIASGGEMSRVMLALKTVLADSDNIETFIFDEIDAGVSGRTAQMVAEKLALLAGKRQILCITHLPQIAAMGDNNILIEKRVRDRADDQDDGRVKSGRAVTGVKTLSADELTDELARLLGGAEITGATISAAREMRGLACRIKQKIRECV